jgi:putative hemolysin
LKTNPLFLTVALLTAFLILISCGSKDATHVTGVSLNNTALTLDERDSIILVADVEPINATNKKLLWESSHTNIATVSDGSVNCITEGTTTITVTTQDGEFTATCVVTVIKGPDVYVAGNSKVNGRYEATVWKNDIPQILPSAGPFADARSVFVSGDDVYVTGYSSSEGCILWKNGVPQILPGGTGYASSVFVSGTDVYVAGSSSEGATLWKNGAPQILWGGTSAVSVFVSGTDVYVVGDNNLESAILWKNGDPQVLSGGCLASSVFVSGTDVYVAGDDVDGWNTVAILWKNGARQVLFGGRLAGSVFVPGDDVYVTGDGRISGSDASVLWKNNIPQAIGFVPGNVFVHGSREYVAGFTGGFTPTAKLWKNGVTKTLSTDGEAHWVFIKP